MGLSYRARPRRLVRFPLMFCLCVVFPFTNSDEVLSRKRLVSRNQFVVLRLVVVREQANARIKTEGLVKSTSNLKLGL
jgi:hypothetical protein